MRLLTWFLLTLSLTGTAQTDFILSTYPTPIAPELLKKLKQRRDNEWSSFNLAPGADKNVAQKAHKKEFDNLVKAFSDGHLMTDHDISRYLQALVNHISLDNGLEADEILVYAYRSDVPNAASLGTGVITIMLGLLTQLQTEDQVAFVLAHEMAHVLGRHNIQSIEEIAIAFNKDVKRQVNNAQSSVFNSYTQAAGLLENAERGYLRHSRSHEYEADSLALTLFLQAGFHPDEAIRALELLDRVDDQDVYAAVDASGRFEIPESRRAAMYSEVAKLHRNEKLPDSLTTHPDCALRIEALKRQIGRQSPVAPITSGQAGGREMASRPSDASSRQAENKVAELAGLNMVDGEFKFGHYGKSLYHSIGLADAYPKQAYLAAMSGRSLYEMYTRQRDHTLGTSVDHPDPRYPNSYNKVLSLFHLLRLTELEQLTYEFMVSQPEEFFEDEHFLFALWQVSHLKISKLDPESIKEDYLEEYPNGYYVKVLK